MFGNNCPVSEILAPTEQQVAIIGAGSNVYVASASALCCANRITPVMKTAVKGARSIVSAITRLEQNAVCVCVCVFSPASDPDFCCCLSCDRATAMNLNARDRLKLARERIDASSEASRSWDDTSVKRQARCRLPGSLADKKIGKFRARLS